ncbi:hypothetical protein M9979_16825 [Sphingomonas sp. RP10(2022)]|uniref:Glycosyltransferase RgtA/B/C/D-like domain-containing protein n=1 Tax=Sphingomonas liriopis TaxID=2949094 RepID=A0A9X2HU06_9SPHN|nr:hypothetical protein [Sphingomonas liriopis]MCP3736532.1 hypothetical protein [Sphingomonas liriopis]
MTARRIWLILTLVAIALRLPDIGNPLVDLDEQMYLLVGQRMWDGAIPYVDIWDRKPIGLFLIYAASAALPGDPVIAYHLVALAAAIGTAGMIATFVRRFAGGGAALAAGILYLVWIALIGGRGGQSPVFYDLPVAAAALLTWDTLTGRGRAAVPAMLLAGLALQIKPTVVFEGCFLGCALLLASWRRRRDSARIAAAAAVYVAVALAPTIAAWAVYAALGHGDAWWFANVRSIFLRRVVPGDPILDRLLGAVLVLAVPMAIAVRGVFVRARPMRLFLGGWLVVAVIGWLLVPPYFNHYALPLVVPIAIAAGGAFASRPMRWLAGVAGAALLIASSYPHWGETADARRRLKALATVFGTGRGCPFAFQAPPALYTAAHACLPTRYPFPPHLVEASEAGAIGIDQQTEIARILAARPPVIAVGRPVGNGNRVASAMVERTLAHGYRPVARDLGVTLYAADMR